MFKNQLCFNSLKFGLAVLTSVFVVNSAIVTLPSTSADTAEAARKEKRGIYGFGAHGHHHNQQPYDDYPPPLLHHHNAPPPPIPPPVNLGAHFHTTITKKIGVPIPYPYPVKVRNYDFLVENSFEFSIQEAIPSIISKSKLAKFREKVN